MPKKIDDALSGYTNERSILEAQEQKTHILAGMAGEAYDPDQIPKTIYNVDMRMRESMQKENEYLERIAAGAGTVSGANKLAIDYGTDVLSLKKNGTSIPNSSVTLPSYGLSCDNSGNSLTLTKNGSGVQGQTVSLPDYGLSYNTSTGGLTLTRNGTGIQDQTVSLPPYGTPLTASSTAGMTDTSKVYVNTTDGNWYYYDGDSWEIGGTYNSQGIDTDTTLAVSGAPADAQATGTEITNIKNLDALVNRTLFKVPYTPRNISRDSNGRIYLDKGYVNQTTGYSSATSTTSSVYGKYYRTQAGVGSSYTFLEIGDKPLLVTLGLDWVQWTCFSYSGSSNNDATHSNSRSAYIPGTEAIFIPKNSTDTRFSLGFRGIGNGDANRPVFTTEQVNAIKDAIKIYVLTDNSLTIRGSAADAKAVGDAISSITSGLIKEAGRLGLHTVPENMGVLNAIKRARQMTDIKWTPKFDIPYRYFGSYGPSGHTFRLYGGFKAGTEYTGLPYSEHRWIGSTWPFAAFITSLSSDKTHLATFVPGSGSDDYADSTFYGVVCVVLVSYAINRPVAKSNSFLHINGLSEIGDITESNIDSIKLGDIMYSPTHVMIITDIIKDGDGHVTDVEISEATSGGLENWNDLWGKYGGLCRRVMYNKTDFLNRASTFSLCRYAYISDVPYEYTNYSALAEDGYYEPIGNYPVLPIRGNFIRQQSDSVRLIVTMDATEDTRGTTLPEITHVVVKRNGIPYGSPLEIQTQAADEVVTWNAAAGSTVTIKAGTRYVNVTFDEGDEAAFTAIMAAMSNGSALEYGRMSRFFKYGPTKTYIPDGRTVQTSSGGFKYLSKLSNGNHEFTIRRKTTEFIPYAVAFGNDSNNLGSINGYSSNVYTYTVSEVTENNETWYEFHFEVTPPKITSPELVPAVVSWKSVNYGVFEASATSASNVVGNDNKSLYYHV